MATCEMKYDLENDNCITNAIDFSFLLQLEGLDELDEPICPDNWHPNSSQDGSSPGYPFEDVGIISADDIMTDIEKENVADLNNRNSVSIKDTSSVQEEESTECNKRKHSEIWFLEDLDLEEPTPKRPVLDYLETATVQLQKTSQRTRKIEHSMRVRVLKGLTSMKARECWSKKCQDLFTTGSGLCCNKNCWMRWEFIDVKRILADWY